MAIFIGKMTFWTRGLWRSPQLDSTISMDASKLRQNTHGLKDTSITEASKFAGWRFQTYFIFSYIYKLYIYILRIMNHPDWLIFFRGVETTNQFGFFVQVVSPCNMLCFWMVRTQWVSKCCDLMVDVFGVIVVRQGSTSQGGAPELAKLVYN